MVRGKPQDILPQLFQKWGVSRMTYEYDTEPYSRSRDLKVSELAKEHGVEVVYKISHTLHDVDRSVTHPLDLFPLSSPEKQCLSGIVGPRD